MSTSLEKRPAREVQGPERTRPWFQPRVNILETQEELVLTANIPGVKTGGIDLRFEKGTLSIHATVADRQPEGTRYLVREYAVGDYHRTFEVNESIDHSRISAEYSDGVLTLHLPKVETAKPRKISVSVK